MDKRVLVVVLLALLGCQQEPKARQTVAPTRVEGRTVETSLPDVNTVAGGDYVVTLTLKDYDPGRDSDAYQGLFGSTKPRVVTDFKVTYKGEDVYVPMSAYGDLSNIHQIELEPAFDDAILRIEGGDAHEGYRCRMTFMAGLITSRHLEHGEFPEHENETTVYTLLSPDN
jgi:hypothetical protein